MSSLQPPGLSLAVLQARQAVVRSPSKHQVADNLALAPRALAAEASPLVSLHLAQITTAPDSLGKHAKLHSRLFLSGGSDAVVRATCPRGDVLLQHGGKQHTALVLLSSCAKNGVPVVTSTAPWSEKLLAQWVKRGSHQSCEEHKPFLREEMLDFVNKGFFTLLPWRLVKDPPGLRVSPLGIIPQRE